MTGSLFALLMDVFLEHSSVFCFSILFVHCSLEFNVNLYLDNSDNSDGPIKSLVVRCRWYKR